VEAFWGDEPLAREYRRNVRSAQGRAFRRILSRGVPSSFSICNRQPDAICPGGRQPLGPTARHDDPSPKGLPASNLLVPAWIFQGQQHSTSPSYSAASPVWPGHERLGNLARNAGEASVLAWAEAHGAAAYVDDQVAYNIGRSRGARVHRTLQLIVSAVRATLLSEQRAQALVNSLADSDARFPQAARQDLFAWAQSQHPPLL